MNENPNQQASSAPAPSIASNNSPPQAHLMGTDLQQALFQSAQGAGHGHSNSFAAAPSNQVQGQGEGQHGHNHALSLSQMDIVQQLIGMGADKNNSNYTAAPFAQHTAPHPMQAQNNNGNNNIVSQLIASLQAQQVQQQSQQQAQVQAALSRAFGPSSVGGNQGQLQMQQQPNNQNNLLSQIQIAQAQGLLSSNNNFLPNMGGMGNDAQNRMFQIKRAAMMAGGQDAKKQKIDNSSLQFGSGNLFNSVPGLSNSLFPNSVPGLPGLMKNTASAFGQDNEVDLQQKLAGARGAVIVPCRARGMPVDHNFKTAYFVIPNGIEHGDELVCSFPACRQAGVKFRYCIDCKVPVAKRNFRNRHRHGVPGADEEGVSDDDDGDSGDEEEGKEEDPTKGDMCMPADATMEREHLIVIPDGKLKKKNKSVRVPCRARGMPMAHNFKTAHFIIPPTIQHGDELVCSFPPCRAAGAKFRYCLHCKVPVAKRNFRNRHKHGNLGEKKKGSPTQEKKDVSTKAKEAEIEVAEGKSEERRSSEELSDDTADEGDLKPSASPVKIETNAGGTQTTVAINSNHDPNQVQQWVSLLDTKPDPSDKEAMAIWMMNLMHATEAMSSKTSNAAASTSPEASGGCESKPEVPELPVKEDNETSELKSEGAGETKSEETAPEKTSDV